MNHPPKGEKPLFRCSLTGISAYLSLLVRVAAEIPTQFFKFRKQFLCRRVSFFPILAQTLLDDLVQLRSLLCQIRYRFWLSLQNPGYGGDGCLAFKGIGTACQFVKQDAKGKDIGSKVYEAAPNSVESEGRFRLSTILSHLSFGVHRNLVSEFGFQHPEVLVALDAPEVLLRLQKG